MNISDSFLKMVEACLDPEPAKRPSAAELLENDFLINPNMPTTQEGASCKLISPLAPSISSVVPPVNQSTVHGGTNQAVPAVVPELNQLLSQTEDMSRTQVHELEEVRGQSKLLDSLGLLQAKMMKNVTETHDNVLRDLAEARQLLNDWGDRIQINKRKLQNDASTSESIKKTKHQVPVGNDTQNPASGTACYLA